MVATPDSVLGIDIAKAKVDTLFQRVHAREKPKYASYDNTAAGHHKLLDWLVSQQVGSLHVCLEATGTYGDALALCLHEAGYTVSIVNPLRIKRYGESELLRVKSDKTDAALIARFCLTQHPDPWTPPPPERRQLQDLVRSLQDLQRLHQQQATRQHSGAHLTAVAQASSAVLSCLQQQMAALRLHIEQHLLTHESLKGDYELLLSIVGIGKPTAALWASRTGRCASFLQWARPAGLCRPVSSHQAVRLLAAWSRSAHQARPCPGAQSLVLPGHQCCALQSG